MADEHTSERDRMKLSRTERARTGSIRTEDFAETEATTSFDEPSSRSKPVPVLTILAHPDPSRVGERLILRALSLGREALLARSEGMFSPPDGSLKPRPLGGLSLSRQPIRLRSGDDASVLIDLSTTRTKVEADGERVVEKLPVSAERMQRGVVLRLGREAVVLLHRMPSPSEEDRDVPRFGLVGESAAVVRLRREIRRLASLDVPVLLRGETGTGKELAARALHEAGARRGKPFKAVNMGALNPALAAAELFGATRGAYTGADRAKEGYFRSAQGGTLFLDEIGDAPPEIQVLLLRALETREIQPVGSTDSIPVDVRLIAATDARLEEKIAAEEFRAPLYHRLAGYTVRLPALRERRDDLGRLLYFFLEEELAEIGEPSLQTTNPGAPSEPWPSPRIVSYLARQDWPGNVRELRNAARRLVIAGREESLDPEEILPLTTESSEIAPASFVDPAPPTEQSAKKLRKISEIGEEELLRALRENRWRLQAAADALSISRPNLYRLMDDCPNVRKAKDLDHDEITAAFAATKNLDEAALRLEVSPLGLKRRAKALDLLDS